MSRVEDLAEHLQGTAKSLDEACEELFGHDSTELSIDECEALDEEVFLCAECGWWCEIGEANAGPNGEDVCDDCA